MLSIRQRDVSPDIWDQLQTVAGITPKATRKWKRPDVRTASAVHWSITLSIACRVISEANRRDHWTVQRRRAEIQGDALNAALKAAGLLHHETPVPVVVTWTRIGRQQLDDDNLQRAFKSLRDSLAKWIGIDDGDPLVKWEYRQQTGEPDVMVEIASRAT